MKMYGNDRIIQLDVMLVKFQFLFYFSVHQDKDWVYFGGKSVKFTWLTHDLPLCQLLAAFTRGSLTPVSWEN